MAGIAMRKKPMPHDFIAVISLELDRRPNVRSVASSIDIGNVHMMTFGRPKTKTLTTALSDAP